MHVVLVGPNNGKELDKWYKNKSEVMEGEDVENLQQVEAEKAEQPNCSSSNGLDYEQARLVPSPPCARLTPLVSILYSRHDRVARNSARI